MTEKNMRLRNEFRIDANAALPDIQNRLSKYFTFDGMRALAVKLQKWCEDNDYHHLVPVRNAANNAANATDFSWRGCQLAEAFRAMSRVGDKFTIKVNRGYIESVYLHPDSTSSKLAVVIDAEFKGSPAEVAAQLDDYLDRFVLSIPLPLGFKEEDMTAIGRALTDKVRFMVPNKDNVSYPLTAGNLLSLISFANTAMEGATVFALMSPFMSLLSREEPKKPSFFDISNKGAEDPFLRELFADFCGGPKSTPKQPSLDDLLRDLMS